MNEVIDFLICARQDIKDAPDVSEDDSDDSDDNDRSPGHSNARVLLKHE